MVKEFEDVEDSPPRRFGSFSNDAKAIKHGDRALQFIGDERVELTEEDVSLYNACKDLR